MNHGSLKFFGKFFGAGALLAFWPVATLAATVALPNKPGTFSLAPARQEILIAAGATKTINFRLVNHLGRTQNFSLTGQNVAPLNNTREGFAATTAPQFYAWTGIATIPKSNLVLADGEEATIPVAITIPADWPAISLAGLIIISPIKKESPANAQIKTGAGGLVLVRVAGTTLEAGQLEKFGLLEGSLVTLGELIRLQVAYQNTGNVYLNPYGAVYLSNIFGQRVVSQFLDPWFVLPQSIRLREVALPSPSWPGLYRADLALNLGYQNRIVTASVYFWVVPAWWQIVVAIIILLLLLRLVLKRRW